MSFAFISHRSVDKPRLRAFMLRLVAKGVPLWIDNVEQFNVGLPPNEARIERQMLAGGIRQGADWPVEIDKALLNAFAIVLFWSRAWQADRAVLAREHGVALARHRDGKAVYLPVFLDSPDDEPPELAKYRLDAGDLVQGFDVARYGQDQWTALLDAIERAWRASKNGGGTSKPALPPVPSPGSIDWAHEVESAREETRSVFLLRALPEGPAVNTFQVSPAIIRAYAAGTDTVRAAALVAEATQLVLAALDSPPPNPHAYVITPGSLPVTGQVGLANYWQHVFEQACLLGPRMLGALLLAAPPTLLFGVRPQTTDLFRYMEAMS